MRSSTKFFIILLLICVFAGRSFAQELIKDVYWDEERNILSYKIPKDSEIKIRAGSADGPIYKTLVNMQGRRTGMNQEMWDGKDELGRIDFSKFGPIHFCIDMIPSGKRDLPLIVREKFASEEEIRINQDKLSLTVDIDEDEKSWFCEDMSEVMVFVDNKLIRLKSVKSLPYSLVINRSNFSPGQHLLTLNVWSSDHSSVAYKNMLITAENSKKAMLVEDSNDAKTSFGKLAYCERIKGYWQVWAADLNGSKPRQLTKNPIDKRYPRFSNDMKKIAYVTNDGELWVMNVDGRQNRRIQLPVHASQPRWAVDDRRILFVSYQDLYYGDTEIWEVTLDTLKLKKLTNRPWMQYDPCYSPDGKRLLFTDGPELYAQEMRKLDLQTGDVTQLTENGPYDYDMHPAYSNDGEAIIYASNQNGTYDIWLTDKYGRDPKNLTKNPAHDIMPHFSADGKGIYFLSNKGGAFEIWRIDADGSNLHQITNNNKDKQDLTLYAKARSK